MYFRHKEQLFEAIVEQECELQAEGIFDLDPNDHDVEAVLTRLGVAYVKFLCRPEKAQAIRTVIAIAERMPDGRRKIYQTGPARGIAQLAAYIGAQVAAGVLLVEDCEIAAAQLMEACQAMIFKSMVFNFASALQAPNVSSVWCGSRSRLSSRPIVRQGRSQSRHCEERKRRSNPGFPLADWITSPCSQ